MQKPTKGVQLQRGHPLARGLIGAWLINEVTGPLCFDLTGQGHDGTLINNAVRTFGTGGPAVNFDGSSSEINCGTISQANFTTGDFTIVSRCISTSIGDQQMILNNGVYNDSGYYLQLFNSEVEFYMRGVGINRLANFQPLSSDTLYDIVGVRRGNGPLEIWIDGVEATYGVQNNADTLTASGYPVRIGDYPTGALSFLGDIYYTYIYDRALSEAEIKSLAANPYQMFQTNITPEIFGTIAAVGGTNIQLNIGDVWKTVAGMQINIGDSWKTVAGAQINIGDAWKTIF